MSKALKLTDLHFCLAAGKLQCEPDALKAVTMVEAPRGPFDADGFPTILFERHKFYKNADRVMRDEWQREFPTICNRNVTPQGGYGSFDSQRAKFSQAFALDSEAAMMACSWGAFQELGENYDDYGFASVGEFVDMMKSGVDGQLEIFVRSIKRRGLQDELQRLDWKGFARNYNGPTYWKFEYDQKMAAEYARLIKRPIDCAVLKPAAKPTFPLVTREIEQLVDNIGPDTTSPPETLPNDSVAPPDTHDLGNKPAETGAVSAVETAPAGDQPNVPPSSWLSVEDWKPMVSRWLTRIWGFSIPANVTQFSGLGFAAISDPPNWVIYIAIAVFLFIILGGAAILISGVLLCIWYFNRKEINSAKMLEAKLLADPTQRNIGVAIEKK